MIITDEIKGKNVLINIELVEVLTTCLQLSQNLFVSAIHSLVNVE